LFTGREYEKDLNLYYYRARFYDPVNGRFISRDPIGMGDNVDLYTYVANNPLKFADPMGREKKFIANNEGNAWYIEQYSNRLDIAEHAMLLYIHDKKAHLISYYPAWRNGSNYNHESQQDVEQALQYTMKWWQSDNNNVNIWETEKGANVTYIDHSKIDTDAIEDWSFPSRNSSHSSWYNLFTHNCADEVDNALVIMARKLDTNL